VEAALNTRFANRVDAGAQLARRLSPLAQRADVLVLGLVPGGLEVAEEVGRLLDLRVEPFRLSFITVGSSAIRPIGAVTSGGIRVLDQLEISRRMLSRRLVDEESEIAGRALARQEGADEELPDLRGRIVIVVDDIAATANSLVTAVRALRQLGPEEVIVAVPMMTAVAAAHLAACADRCVTAWIAPEPCTPEQGYLEFPALSPHAVMQRG
jgi:putative phosphoribosyl transferase